MLSSATPGQSHHPLFAFSCNHISGVTLAADTTSLEASPLQYGRSFGTHHPHSLSTMALSSVASAILKSSLLVSSLSQVATNGNSVFGTLQAPLINEFLTNNPLPQGFPWGTRTANNSNPYENSPTTGVIRAYDFTIKRGFIAPDGVNKSVILVNGQFPAPLIEANWGDTIQVKVRNEITGPEEGTALHWHGLLQRATPWYDGVPSVMQCPIPPGKSLTYQFKADIYGSSWYHSHYSGQYAGGLFGPMIIHGPKNVPYDRDVGPVLLSDWYHEEYFSIVKRVMAVGGARPFSDNSLINGKMNFDCSQLPAGDTRQCTPNAGIAKFRFVAGKRHRLRLINASSEALLRFSIDNHTMTVMANDFVPVKPYTTSVVTLGVGQRTDVIVEANLPAGSAVFMRSFISRCSAANQPLGLAAIYYDGADTTKTPTSVETPVNDAECANDPLKDTIPFFPFPATTQPATTVTIGIRREPNATGHQLWTMNRQTFRGNMNQPVLLLANRGNTSYPNDPQWNVYNFGTNNSIRIILENFSGGHHPMHLHGHNFNILADGVGKWDGTIVNQQNTQRRDVHIIRGAVGTSPGYIVLQFIADNPGVWPFHCHIAWHVSGGLYVNIMERPDRIQQRIIPDTIRQTCREWDAYTNTTVPDIIDSGL